MKKSTILVSNQLATYTSTLRRFVLIDGAIKYGCTKLLLYKLYIGLFIKINDTNLVR